MGEGYFTGWLNPRRINGLGDYFEFNLLPKIEGVYSEKQLRFTNLPYTETKIDAARAPRLKLRRLATKSFLGKKTGFYLSIMVGTWTGFERSIM